MPKVKEPKLYSKEIIEMYNYPKTRDKVLHFFLKYRLYALKIDTISDSYNCSFTNDSMGIFSCKKNDSTANKAMKILECKEYVNKMNKQFKALRYKLTNDEKIIFNYSILSRHTDEELAERLALDKSSIYQRKKSCFIKVAQYFNIEVLK